jgi:hypothetical protein
MDTTIRAIVKARKLPLSIVIVGVGDDDFENMKILDADDKPLTMVNYSFFFSSYILATRIKYIVY